jgi:hypothetical protein
VRVLPILMLPTTQTIERLVLCYIRPVSVKNNRPSRPERTSIKSSRILLSHSTSTVVTPPPTRDPEIPATLAAILVRNLHVCQPKKLRTTSFNEISFGSSFKISLASALKNMTTTHLVIKPRRAIWFLAGRLCWSREYNQKRNRQVLKTIIV